MLCYLLLYSWGYSSVVRAFDCRSTGPWFKPGCQTLYFNNEHLFISKQGYIIMLCYLLPYSWGYISVVEHSTAEREVPGSNPGVPDISRLLTFVDKYIGLYNYVVLFVT